MAILLPQSPGTRIVKCSWSLCLAKQAFPPWADRKCQNAARRLWVRSHVWQTWVLLPVTQPAHGQCLVGSCHLPHATWPSRREESGVMETTHYCIGQLLFLKLDLIHTIAQAGLRLMAILLPQYPRCWGLKECTISKTSERL